MAISFSNALQGYKVFWSVLTENKKTLQYFHHRIVKYRSLDTEDFLFSPFSVFSSLLGLKFFPSDDAKLRQFSRLLPLER